MEDIIVVVGGDEIRIIYNNITYNLHTFVREVVDPIGQDFYRQQEKYQSVSNTYNKAKKEEFRLKEEKRKKEEELAELNKSVSTTVWKTLTKFFRGGSGE